MAFTDEEKRELAARARPLATRLTAETDDALSTDATGIENVIERWKDNVADGNDAAFRRRLTVDGVGQERLRARLAPGEGPPSDSVPWWVEFVDELQSRLELHADKPGDSTGDGDEEPFEGILDPIVEFAVARLDDVASAPPVRDSAVRDGATALEDRLRELYLHPLFIEFKTSLRNGTGGTEGEPTSRAGYRAFVRERLDSGLREFFLEYAVLARWTAVLVEQWTAAFEEFVRRLRQDWERLDETVTGDEPLGEVVHLEFLGDPHHGGRQVIGVTTDSGVRFAYKPRDLRPEARYFELLSWLNAESSLPDLRVVDCIPRDGYGWMEWIEPTDCSSVDEVDRYFERVGALICVLYVLRFADGNIENVVAEGSQPVVLDLEGLLQPDLPDDITFGEPSLLDIIDGSVLQTSIPPLARNGADLEDVSGIDRPSGRQSGVRSIRITQPNTDAMELQFEESSLIEGESLPRYDGETASPYDYADTLIGGFEDAYEFFCRERDRVSAVLDSFENLETRTFCRNTATYGKIQQSLLLSDRLRSGLRCGVRVELLTNWMDWDDPDEELWEIYEGERDATWRLDIPRFTVDSSGTDLFLKERTLKSCIETPPIELVRRRLQSMNQRDLGRQVDYLTAAYDNVKLLRPDAPVEGFDADELPDWESVAETHCDEIFERLRESAVRTEDGSLHWYQRVNKGDGVSVRTLRDDIYDGRLGIALYAAALANYFDRDRYREFVPEVTDPLLEALETDDERFVDQRLGAAHGLGSLVYGFVKLSRWLDEPRYLNAATEVSTFITEERLADDDSFDLIGGAAGSILALLALYDETGDGRALERATAAGDALLDSRIDRDGVRVWPTDSETQRTLLGPGHGISGVALALYRLGGTTDRQRYSSAALESLQFAERHYAPEESNWPDFRFDSYRRGWCAGRAGIGLSRLAMNEVDDRNVLRRDLERALSGLDHEQLMSEDQICCGNFSRVEFLLRASRTLGTETYRRQAEELAADVLHRADRLDGFTVPWQTENWYSTSLYLGEPGIGLGLLRLAGADLPCLLLWE